jgi:hypothetical protein
VDLGVTFAQLQQLENVTMVSGFAIGSTIADLQVPPHLSELWRHSAKKRSTPYFDD